MREWNDEDGWGVIDSADTPGGCWVSYASIVPQFAAVLEVGQEVSFTFESAVWQDGYTWRAVEVWPRGVEALATPREVYQGEGSSFRSSLTLEFDDGEGPRGWR